MTFKRDVLASKIPVTIITGFLGAGKTTLVSKLIKHPDMNRVAVVINELGEIGIDNDLVTMSSENISLLSNGCICCSVRTDMQETMRELFAKRMVGEIPEFDRIIIETTGLADPAPILQTLLSDTLFEAQFRLDGLITLVDGFNGIHQIEQQMETCKQLAVADLILITKSDLLDEAAKQALQEAVRQLNPKAPMLFVTNGEIEPKQLVNLGLSSSKSVEKTLGFLGSLLEGKEDAGESYLGVFAKRHNQGIKTLSLRFQNPFTWEAASAALELLTNLRGPDMLRVKGIMNIDGKPVVIQGVQHIFHPPVTLDTWPTDDHESRMVFITKNMEAELIKSLFNAVGAITQTSKSTNLQS
jgi:G3E family GTPase